MQIASVPGGAEPADRTDERGVSTGDYADALQALMGVDPKGFSPNVIVRLKEKWGQEYEEWSRRDLSGEEYVYVWADGIHVNVRLEDEGNQKQCLLVFMGATAEGRKELIAIGDGALGFWAALREVYPTTKEQRCWVHKTANVLKKMPKALRAKAKSALHQIWLDETREMATKAFDHFLEKYGAKYEAACSCLSKDRDVLLAFYDFPAEHWGHLRTTNPIEAPSRRSACGIDARRGVGRGRPASP
ncbi:MAG: transposase [Planctomycetia bacterium]